MTPRDMEEQADDVELARSAGSNATIESLVDIETVREVLAAPPPKSIKDYTLKGYIFTVLIGLSMAFSAGYANGVCLSGFLNVDANSAKQSVAGVTGVYTMSAIFLGEKDFQQAGFMFGTIFSVMFGAFVAAIMNPRPIAFEISPRYGPTFLIASVFMALGAIEVLHNNRREFFFTAIANGIQNGISSMYSANLLRTSHLTGTTTDIGLFLGMALRGNRTNNWKLYILIGLAVSFWLGSVSGFFASQVKYENSLIFNAAFFVLLSMCVIIRTCIVYQVSFFNALLGTGKWMDALDHLDVVPKDAGSSATDKALHSEELNVIFDDVAAQNDGRVDQNALIEYLTSHDFRVKKHRKPLVAVLHSAFAAHGDGDWKLSKEEWNGLIHQSMTTDRSMMLRSSIMSSRQLSSKQFSSKQLSSKQLSSRQLMTDDIATLSGPEALRYSSIMQYSTSLLAISEDS